MQRRAPLACTTWRNLAIPTGPGAARAVLIVAVMHLRSVLVSLVLGGAVALAGACAGDKRDGAQPAPPSASASPSASPSPSPSPPPSPSRAPAPAPVAGASDAGPPAIARMIPGEEAGTAGPFRRGDYLVALDYRPEGFGTYGFLYHGDGRIWFVENDEVVGGPFDENGPELQQVVARWTAAEKQRHRTVMLTIDALPKGCITGCAFNVYENGAYVGTRIEY